MPSPTLTNTSSPPRNKTLSDDISDDFRIAVVGCGPRGLYSLERLAQRLSECSLTRKPTVYIFEPTEYLGAGNVYDPSQPHFLRMNFAAKHIDAWIRRDAETDQLDLISWLQRYRPHLADRNAFIPRAVVGEYLEQCFAQVLNQLERFANVVVVRQRVECVAPCHSKWELECKAQRLLVDEVLVTVGHEGWRTTDQSDTSQQLIPAFPISSLTEDQIAPNSTVTARGFGLTFIDVALALTEGRGGSFRQGLQGWSYHPCGREPRKIIPYSRSGRPLFAKPDEHVLRLSPQVRKLIQVAQLQLRKLTRPLGLAELESPLWQIICSTTADAFNLQNRDCGSDSQTNAEEVKSWLQQWRSKQCSGREALESLRHSYRVATGRAAPDLFWALGTTWRGVYPALVRLVSHGGLTELAMQQFVNLSCEFERIAFGPPAENVGRLVALIDAGIVDLSQLTTSTQTKSEHVPRADHHVYAMIPSPYELDRAGPLKSLLENSSVRRLHGRWGIEVDLDGQPCTEPPGQLDGLTLLGRCTEGCILGNDTLSRKLHDHPGRWADRISHRLKTLQNS